MVPSQMLLVPLANFLDVFWSLFTISSYDKHPERTWILQIDPRVDCWDVEILFLESIHHIVGAVNAAADG